MADVADDPGEAQDGPDYADESFENALPVESGGAPVGSQEATGAADAAEPPASPPPSLESAVQRVPAATRELLTELFKAEFTAVRRIPRDRWL